MLTVSFALANSIYYRMRILFGCDPEAYELEVRREAILEA